MLMPTMPVLEDYVTHAILLHVFTADECKRIKQAALALQRSRGAINKETGESLRDSEVAWIHPDRKSVV